MNIIRVNSPNFTTGRNGRKIIAIVNHITAGNYPGCLTWMQNPSSKASAHYLVTKRGEVFQLVRDEDTAWHAGIVNKPNWPLYDGSNPNRYALGIEHENLGGGELTEDQYQATLELHRQLTAKYSIPVDADHIIGHYRVDSVNRPNCPGAKFPWVRLLSDLRESEDLGMVYKKVEDVPSWGKPTIEKLIKLGYIAPNTDGSINIPHEILRVYVVNDRAGLYK